MIALIKSLKFPILEKFIKKEWWHHHTATPSPHTDWFQEFFSNNSLFWRYSLELSNLRFVWPYISLKNPRNFRKAHGKFSEPFYIENTKFHFNIMTEISTFFGPDFLCHWMPLNFCLKYLCNWQLMYARAKILA